MSGERARARAQHSPALPTPPGPFPPPADARHDVTVGLVAHDGERWLPGAARRCSPARPGRRDRSWSPPTPAATAPRRRQYADPLSAVGSGRGHRVGAACRPRPASAPPSQAALDSHRSRPTGSGCCTTTARPSRTPSSSLLADVDATTRGRGRRSQGARLGDRPAAARGRASPSPAAAAATIGLERREQDQGQHDGVRRVPRRRHRRHAGPPRRLGRSSAGFDPRLPLLRDDVDLGWRANLAGHRVVVRDRRRRAPRRGGQPPSSAGARRRRAAAPARPAARAATCCWPTCRCRAC